MSVVRSRACETARALASRSLDETLDVVPRELLALHLATCGECARFAADTEAATHLLRREPLVATRVEVRGLLRRPAPRRTVNAVAAAAAAALSLGLASLAGGSAGPLTQTAAPPPGRVVVVPVKLPIGQRLAEAEFAVGARSTRFGA